MTDRALNPLPHRSEVQAPPFERRLDAVDRRRAPLASAALPRGARRAPSRPPGVAALFVRTPAPSRTARAVSCPHRCARSDRVGGDPAMSTGRGTAGQAVRRHQCKSGGLLRAGRREVRARRVGEGQLPCGLYVQTARGSRAAAFARGDRVRARRAPPKPKRGPPVAANVLARRFEAAAPNVAWATDITPVPTREGRRLSRAAVVDSFSRRVVYDRRRRPPPPRPSSAGRVRSSG